MLFTFSKRKTPLCSFCHSYDETIKHIFSECICVKQLWNHLNAFKKRIKSWKPNCSCRLCKTYLQGVGFINITE